MVSRVRPVEASRVTVTVWFELAPREGKETVTVRPETCAPETTVSPEGIVKT